MSEAKGPRAGPFVLAAAAAAAFAGCARRSFDLDRLLHAREQLPGDDLRQGRTQQGSRSPGDGAHPLAPIYAATAQDGQIPGWPAWSHILPRGGDAPYDLLSATTCKDPPSVVRGHLGGAADFAKVHPTRSFVSAVDKVRAARKTGIVLVSRVLAVTRKSVTRQ